MHDALPISVQNLVIDYPTRSAKTAHRAVDDLSFSVHSGEIVGFLGVNGAGKTSTIKALMGFQPPTGGSATLFGQDVAVAEARGAVGFLPETALYSPFLTPTETLRLYGELHGMDGKALEARIKTLLTLVGLSEKMRVLNRTLSKGMLQRVGIAQALLASPRLLILDEVSSGLDPIGRRDLRDILKQQQAEGVTIFFSSHELGEVELICDRILVLHKGRLVAAPDVPDLTRHVRSLEEYFVTLVESGRDLLAESKSRTKEIGIKA